MSDPLDELIANTPPASADELDALIKSTPAAAAPNGVVGGRHGIAGPVGPWETYLNDASGMLPAGRVLVNALAAGITKAATPSRVKLGRAALEAGGRQSEPEPGFWDTYRDVRGAEAAREVRGDKDNPAAKWLGRGTGLALSLMAPLPKFSAASGAGILGKAAALGSTAVGYGAVNALTNGRADLTRGELGQAVEDLKGTEGLAAAREDFKAGNYGRAALDFAGAGIPGALGTAGAISLAAPLVRVGGQRLVRALAKPTPEAQMLLGRGVPLTLGQMNQAGPLGQVEQVSTHSAGAGSALEAQRDAALDSWRQLALREGTAPGAPPPAPVHDMGEQLAAQHAGFEQAYAPIKAQPAAPLVSAPAAGPIAQGGQAPRAAVPLHEAIRPTAESLADSLASDQDAAIIRRYLDNQSTKLVNQADAGRSFNADSLLSMRSDIRGKIRQALQSQNHTQAQLLQDAADTITRSLGEQLPEEAMSALRQTDAAYANHLKLTNAVAKAKDSPHGFTPAQLQDAVRSGVADKGAYARGGGGPLRELSHLGRAVFDAKKVPPTGVTKMVLAVPGAHHVTAPLLMSLNGSDAVRAMAAGAPSVSTGAGMSAAVAHALAMAALLRRREPNSQLPVEDETP